ncbi:MAG: carboxypeptidase-like regulatory domain-containing protein [Bacteroidales bacterium]|nr:carboxypeptidase-like regulatory domain-containing protein [Bacteroidales bacterium]
MKKLLIAVALCAALVSCRDGAGNGRVYNDSLPPVAAGYVGLADDHFVLDGEEWFPRMLNYKAFIEGDRVVPAPYYTGNDVREHFDTIAAWGFNAVRVCLDVMGEGDSTAMFSATRRMVQQADSAGLHVMLLIKTPFDPYWQSYTKGLLRHLADMPALWAYDFMNEPLYFDPVADRDKMDAVRLVEEWRHWVRIYAPHQLFTVATAEPIEVFEWDPSMLPVDFIEMHTYHPLRVLSEMWWYSHYCGKPWMVGETGLPADNDSVPYGWQLDFMAETYFAAVSLGAIGYGWWEFQDNPDGVNFEAQYTGLRDGRGCRKNREHLFRYWMCLGPDENMPIPMNYSNMLAYSNIMLTGEVVDKATGKPVEGAVVRGWNDDWSVGMNTYTDSNGRFTLYSNDYNVHFEVSAPGMSRQKFDRRTIHYSNPMGVDAKNLPDRQREYQQIDYRPYLRFADSADMLVFLDLDSSHFFRHSLEGDMGIIKLKRY